MAGSAGVDRNLPALLEADRLAVRPLLHLAVGGTLHLAIEGVGHPGVSDRLRLVVPDLLGVRADYLGDDKLHLLGHKLTVLPGDGLTGLRARPDLQIRQDYISDYCQIIYSTVESSTV